MLPRLRLAIEYTGDPRAWQNNARYTDARQLPGGNAAFTQDSPAAKTAKANLRSRDVESLGRRPANLPDRAPAGYSAWRIAANAAEMQEPNTWAGLKKATRAADLALDDRPTDGQRFERR